METSISIDSPTEIPVDIQKVHMLIMKNKKYGVSIVRNPNFNH
ncbi:hypothetical protein [Kosmotoga pacifica]|nr:hypothetical protein [Kosmotoga pacifica]